MRRLAEQEVEWLNDLIFKGWSDASLELLVATKRAYQDVPTHLLWEHAQLF